MGLSDGAIAAIVCVVFFVVCCPCLAIILIRFFGNEDEDELKNGSTVDDVEEEEEEEAKPVRKDPRAIVVGEIQSTDDGVETSLESFLTIDSSEDLEAQQKKRTGRSHDCSVGHSRGSHDTSVSQQSTTVDVHICNSSSCLLCRQKNDGVTFVTAKQLEPKMVGKLQTGPARWWEFGESFFDLYQQAQASKDNRPAGEHGDEHASVWGIWSNKSRGSKKKRSLKKVSSDGDEDYY
jgi:hypothetical protein